MSSERQPTLRVQINQIDHTFSPPGFLDNSTLPRVPVIRIYGSSSIGKKTCVHIHQVYPYFFADYPGNLNPDDVNSYIPRLTHSLNHAMAISMKRNPHSPNSQFVRAVLLVKGVHFYGFHASYSPFLKIVIVDPSLVSRAVTIMQSGTIMHTRFRVFESHLSYILQFMCDFGLYGCGLIDLDEVWQRGNEVKDNDDDEGGSMAFKPSLYFRESRMALEVDVASHQILNRNILRARNIHHKLEIPATPPAPEPLVPSVRELWEDERSRRRANGLPPSPEIPVDLSENSRGPGGDWAAEARWWDEIRKRIENEGAVKNELEDDGKDWESWVMTTFESVEALWEDQWKMWRPEGRNNTKGKGRSQGKDRAENPFEAADSSSSVSEDGGVNVDVNETMLTSQEMNQLVELEEADWERFFEQKDLIGGENDAYAPDEEERLDLDDGLAPNPPRDPHYLSCDQNPAGSSDPTQVTPTNSPGKRHNPFQEAWVKIAGQSSVSLSFDGSVTPTNRSRRATRSRPPSPSRSPSPSPIRPRTPKAGILPAHNALVLQTQESRHQEIVEAAQESLCQSLLEGVEKPSHQTNSITMSSSQEDPFLYPAKSPRSSPLGSKLSLQAQVMGTRAQSPVPVGEELPEVQIEAFQDSDETRHMKRRKIGHAIETTSSQSSKSQTSQLSAPISSSPFAPFLLSATTSHSTAFTYVIAPPSTSELEASTALYGVQRKIYRDPYYSREGDAPEKSREYSGLLYHLRGEGLGILEEWDHGGGQARGKGLDRFPRRLDPSRVNGWEYASCPPSIREAKNWLRSDAGRLSNIHNSIKVQSQIEGPTQDNIYGLQDSPSAPSDTSRIKQDMTVLSLEIFAPSRGKLVPDPGADEIVAIFYSFQDSQHIITHNNRFHNGKIVVQNNCLDPRRLRNFKLDVVPTELELINQLVDIIVDLDPDVVAGWDIQTASWGYLNARGMQYGLDVSDLISRAPPRPSKAGVDRWGMRKTSTFKVAGRHALNVWRIMRAEQTLTSYTFENLVFHLLRRRVPQYSFSTLTKWYNSAVPAHTARVIQYFSKRTSMILEMLEEAEVITKTAEFARVFGVDFFSVISRGSQFKVESVLFRIAKPESFVLLSPSKQDVGKQNAAECMPLIMEPLSAFYKGPLVVLDFQSLYPSVMIAYNYCYSTCLGRITEFKGKYKFGVTDLPQPVGFLGTLQEHITVAPNGIMYLRSDVRKGLLARMLSELLDTRVMVKQAMKSVSGDKALKRILDARQRGLKYICNVTYGYTSASFSGRMPAVEIADSIVQTGRETLEKAIRLIDSTQKWGARVVYGDTDSLFVYLPGKTKDQAFRIGHDIADSITALNPSPIKLKFEKVYLPCVLMAKKRYVGFKYDNPDDTEAVFDAKGIETVRRDGVPAQQKMVEKCLTILFRTQDLSQVKAYCWRSWMRILEDKVSIQDFIFAKEVRMGTYSDRAPPPPGVMVAARRMIEDQNDEPQYGERVPYVITRGEPHSRLVDRSVPPKELLDNSHKHLDGVYYISRVLIPPLERIFNLVGADVRNWYEEMPKTIKADQPNPALFSPKKDASNHNRFKIDEHFHSSQCLNCGTVTLEKICNNCRLKPQITISGLLTRVQTLERRLIGAHQICASCTASESNEPIECESLDCPWLFERKRCEHKAESLSVLEECIKDMMTEEFLTSTSE